MLSPNDQLEKMDETNRALKQFKQKHSVRAVSPRVFTVTSARTNTARVFAVSPDAQAATEIYTGPADKVALRNSTERAIDDGESA